MRHIETVRRWGTQDTENLRRSLIAHLERSGIPRLFIHPACDVGLTDEVYTLLEGASFTGLFQPGGRLHDGEAGLHVLFSPDSDSMRHDVRFVKLCARLGLCDYWVRTERWPDCADQLAPFYDFRTEATQYLA